MKAVHTKSVRRFRTRYCPCQANCDEQIPKEGEYLLFKDHHCKERLWSYWCICFSCWRLVWGWIHLCWMFSHILQLWRGDYPRIFPVLNGDSQMCQSVMNTLGKRSCCKTLCSFFMVGGQIEGQDLVWSCFLWPQEGGWKEARQGKVSCGKERSIWFSDTK